MFAGPAACYNLRGPRGEPPGRLAARPPPTDPPVMSLRFVHVSDIHLLDLQGVRPWHYLNKRITGRINLALRRGHQHDGAIFEAAMARAAGLGVDRVVITGDLTNLSLPSEFAHARARLDAAGLAFTVIPGNHDAYVEEAVTGDLFGQHFRAYMDGERRDGAAFPFAQRHGDVVFIGVSTAVPTVAFDATGIVGHQQLERLAAMLSEFGAAGLCRVVLIHHPPVEGVSKPRHELVDLAEFAAVVARFGAELILHGHEHRRVQSFLPGPRADVPVSGIGSTTSRLSSPGREASLALYEASARGIHRELFVWNGNAFAPAPA